MQFRSANRTAGDRVYQAIKARAIAYEFPQGERIYLEPIAMELGVSTTPVREAMNRLAERNLVIKAPQKGFIAMTLSEDNVLGHYELTRILLCHELDQLKPEARRRLSEYEPIAVALNRLKRRRQADFSVVARYTGEIFAAIGCVRKTSRVVLSIDAANDHLYYIRTYECQHLDDVQMELIRLCELLLAGFCEELKCAIEIYHDRRVALLPTLVDALRQ
jgi:DNA-binding GntR family transcriptional regulator